MESNVNVELLCRAMGNGTYRGHIVVDGVPDPVLSVNGGTCEDLRRIWVEGRNKYGVAPSVGADCKDCFPRAFLEEEHVSPIDRLVRGGDAKEET